MKHQELIDSFLAGTLSSEDKLRFDALLQDDESFKRDVKFHQDLIQVTQQEDRSNFRQKVKSFESDLTKKKRFNFKWIAAASIALLLTSSYFLWFQSTPLNESLFSENFQPYRNTVQPIVRGEQSPGLQTQAFVAYESGDYTQASALFSDLGNTESEPYLLFYQANSELALGNSSNAISLFNKYLDNPDDLKDKAQWYLAMAYLKENKLDQVREQLSIIKESEGYNFKEASRLLEDLK